jgi:Protein kinase domain
VVDALGSACLAWLVLTGLVYAISFASRRRAEHGWLAAQSLLAAVYPLWRLDIVTRPGVLAIAIGLACAASVMFTHAHFGLPRSRWTWVVLAALGMLAGVLAELGLPGWALAAVTLLVVAAAVARQIEELWRNAQRFNARVLLLAWALLGASVAVEQIFGQPTTILGLTLLALLYTVALARAHGLGLENAERHRRELEQRVAEIEALNVELRRQIGLRSRQLARALHGSTPTSALGPGTILAERYRITQHLGTGGMGIVYAVDRVTDGSAFALKLLHGHAGPDVLARFAREAEILAQLHHENLVSIVDVDDSDGQLFLVMELVDGTSLAACDRGDLAWCLRVLEGIAAGLVAIHGAGIVHRDLKPANVLVDPNGAAKIADFGVSTFDSLGSGELATLNPLTATGAIMGTPGYMAPELLGGMRAAGFAVDVFAFGVLAYELLGGTPPFETALVRSAAPSLATITPHLPRALIELVDACLAWQPADRPTAAQIVDVLRGVPAHGELPRRERAATAPTLAGN